MRSPTLLLFGVVIPAAFPCVAHAAPVWIGDFEGGDLSQYDGTLNANVNGVDYITIASDIVAQGSYAARIELHDDAVWEGNGLRRVELHHSPAPGRTAEGEQTWFAWSFYLPETLSVDPAQGTGYWESDASYQSLMVWEIAGEQMTFSTRHPDYVQQWQADVATAGTWHRIAAHIVWSQDPAVGLVDVWFDGEQVVTGAAAATLADANSAFTQFGLIRGNMDFADVPVIYIDDAVEGDSLEDVHPELEPTGGDSSGTGIGEGSTTASESGGTTAPADSSGGGSDGSATTPGGDSESGAPVTTATDTGGSSGGGAQDDSADSGCGCRSARPVGPTFALTSMLVVLGVRRRSALTPTARACPQRSNNC